MEKHLESEQPYWTEVEPLPFFTAQIPSEPCTHSYCLRQSYFGACPGYCCYVHTTPNVLALKITILLGSRILLARNSKRAQQEWVPVPPGCLRPQQERVRLSDWALESSKDLFTHKPGC